MTQAKPETTDPDQAIQARRLGQVAALTAVLLAIRGLAEFWLHSGPFLAIVLSLGLVATLGVLYLNHHGATRSGSVLIILNFTVMISVLAWIGQGNHDAVLVAFSATLILAGLLVSNRMVTGLLVAMLLFIAFMAWSAATGYHTFKPAADVPAKHFQRWFDLSSILIASSLMVMLFIKDLHRALARAKTEIEHSRQTQDELEILARHHEDIRLKLQATLDALPDILFEVDLNGRYYDFHSQSMDLLASQPEYFLGKTVSETLPAKVAAVCMAALKEASETGTSRGRQYDLTVPQGRRWFELSIARKPSHEKHETEVPPPDEQRFIVLVRDITLRKLAEDEIRNLAFYDQLTGLPNRRLLLDRLPQALAARARSGNEGALMFIDLDNFKLLNDTLGHEVGDLLLQQVAKRLVNGVRENDTVARIGGDEFVIMLEDLGQTQREAATRAEAIAKKVLGMLNQPYQLGSHDYSSTPSIGVTLFGDRREDMDELLKRADLAMYQAKAAGRNAIRFFDPAMQNVVNARAELEAELRDGLWKNQFVLHYQAQIDLNGKVTGAEALVRWQHPRKGLLLPADFIPMAEESGLILPLGHLIMETACYQLAQWAKRPETAHLTLAVNVSGRQFLHHDFTDLIAAVLQHTGAAPHMLVIELTENLLIKNAESIIEKISRLKNSGIRFSLDDFGTGLSSLSALKRLPLDQLKIDQSFVRDLLLDPNDAAIARTIIALAKSMGLTVVAEGVETEGQRNWLTEQACDLVQGFLFAKPVPLEIFEAQLLRSSTAS